MIAYKFLLEGRVAPFTGFRWPLAQWVEAPRAERCVDGVHACLTGQLVYWLGPELWELELGGSIVEHPRKVVAARGRLVRRIEAWTPGLLVEFAAELEQRARAALERTPELSGYVDDVRRFRSQGRFGLAAFAVARGAELAGGPGAYEQERQRQASWLAGRLGLPAG